jgi:hypothetical protein
LASSTEGGDAAVSMFSTGGEDCELGNGAAIATGCGEGTASVFNRIDGRTLSPVNVGRASWTTFVGLGGCEDDGADIGVVATLYVAATLFVDAAGASPMSEPEDNSLLLPTVTLPEDPLTAAAPGGLPARLVTVPSLRLSAVLPDAVELLKALVLDTDTLKGGGGQPKTPPLI